MWVIGIVNWAFILGAAALAYLAFGTIWAAALFGLIVSLLTSIYHKLDNRDS